MQNHLESRESPEADRAERNGLSQASQEEFARERASREFLVNAPRLKKVNKMNEKVLIKWIRRMPQSEYKQVSVELMERSFSKSKLQSILTELILINSML